MIYNDILERTGAPRHHQPGQPRAPVRADGYKAVLPPHQRRMDSYTWLADSYDLLTTDGLSPVGGLSVALQPPAGPPVRRVVGWPAAPGPHPHPGTAGDTR